VDIEGAVQKKIHVVRLKKGLKVNDWTCSLR